MWTRALPRNSPHEIIGEVTERCYSGPAGIRKIWYGERVDGRHAVCTIPENGRYYPQYFHYRTISEARQRWKVIVAAWTAEGLLPYT